MRKLETLAIVTMSCVACGGNVVPSRDQASSTSLGNELRAAAHDQAVLLVHDEAQELVATTLDHSVKRKLVRGSTGMNQIYDPERELLWYLADETVWVLDLRGSQVPVPIVEHVKSNGFMLDGQSTLYPVPVVSLSWSDPPKLGDSGFQGEAGGQWSESPDEVEQIAQARLVGSVWLQQNLRRSRRHIPVTAFGTEAELGSAAAAAADTDVDVDDDSTGRGECELSCDFAAPLGNTGLLLMVTQHYRDHDGSHHACSLYDPRSRRFVDERGQPHIKLRFDCHGQLDREAKLFMGFATESDHNGGLESGTAVCTRAGCEMLSKRGEDGIGFLDPGARIVDPLRGPGDQN